MISYEALRTKVVGSVRLGKDLELGVLGERKDESGVRYRRGGLSRILAILLRC